LIIPDLKTTNYFGVNGWTLLCWGFIIIGIGIFTEKLQEVFGSMENAIYFVMGYTIVGILIITFILPLQKKPIICVEDIIKKSTRRNRIRYEIH